MGPKSREGKTEAPKTHKKIYRKLYVMYDAVGP